MWSRILIINTTNTNLFVYSDAYFLNSQWGGQSKITSTCSWPNDLPLYTSVHSTQSTRHSTKTYMNYKNIFNLTCCSEALYIMYRYNWEKSNSKQTGYTPPFKITLITSLHSYNLYKLHKTEIPKVNINFSVSHIVVNCKWENRKPKSSNYPSLDASWKQKTNFENVFL